MDKKWFQHIGLYDEQMEIWGGENVGMYTHTILFTAHLNVSSIAVYGRST